MTRRFSFFFKEKFFNILISFYNVKKKKHLRACHRLVRNLILNVEKMVAIIRNF